VVSYYAYARHIWAKYRRSYIVDFEKMNICTIKDPESHFDDDVYRLWGLKDDDRE
jgi:hypothetical protein